MTTEELRILSVKMNAQNNRSTQLPLFVIQYDDKVICPDVFGSQAVIVNEEGREVEEKELCKKCRNQLSDYGVMHHTLICDNCGVHNVWCYREEEKFDLRHGVFLTAEACSEYIKRRSYEMRSGARSYAVSAYWSKETGEVLAYLSSLSTPDSQPVSQYRV